LGTGDTIELLARLRHRTDITPDGEYPTGQSLDIKVVNELFDAVIVQSYQRLYYIDNYINAGIVKAEEKKYS